MYDAILIPINLLLLSSAFQFIMYVATLLSPLTLGAHAQRGLVCLSVCVCVIDAQWEAVRQESANSILGDQFLPKILCEADDEPHY